MQQCCSQSSQSIQDFSIKRPAPELAMRKLVPDRGIKYRSSLAHDFVNCRVNDLRPRNRSRYRVAVDTEGLHTEQTRGEIGGSPSTKWVQNPLFLSGMATENAKREV
jgi:hypothetical protein